MNSAADVEFKQKAKTYAKKVTPPLIWSLLRRFKKNKSVESKYFALNQLDQKLEKYLNYDGGYFVELGANDGVAQSNTLYFEKHRGWKGVLIEPTPHNYLLCRANRAPENHFFCNACTSFGYKDKFVEIIFSNLMSSAVGLESDIPDAASHAAKGKQFLNPTDETFTFGAIAKPLNDLLNEARAPHKIDLLSLDVEGAEIEVLKGINHQQYRFKYLCIESRSKDKLIQYLKAYDYEFVEALSFHDYLFRDAL